MLGIDPSAVSHRSMGRATRMRGDRPFSEAFRGVLNGATLYARDRPPTRSGRRTQDRLPVCAGIDPGDSLVVAAERRLPYARGSTWQAFLTIRAARHPVGAGIDLGAPSRTKHGGTRGVDGQRLPGHGIRGYVCAGIDPPTSPYPAALALHARDRPRVAHLRVCWLAATRMRGDDRIPPPFCTDSAGYPARVDLVRRSCW